MVADLLEVIAHGLEGSEAPPTRIDNRPSRRANGTFLGDWYIHRLRLRGSLSNTVTVYPMFGGIRVRVIGG